MNWDTKGKNTVEKLNIEGMIEKLLSVELMRLEEIKKGSLEVTSLPNHIYVEPTNVCNLMCATCTPPEVKGQKGKLSLELWEDILDCFESSGINPTITLIGRGEPLLHPQIEEIVRMATEKGCCCYIITNGVLLTVDKAKKLLDAGLKRIQVSLHATTAETYEKMTGKPMFEKVCTNIKAFQKINDEVGHPCHVSVISVISPINEHEMDDFEKEWEGKVDRVYTYKMFSLHGDSKMADKDKKSESVSSGPEVDGCSVPWRFFTIRWDGSIIPCALDHASRIVVANFKDKNGKLDMMAAWNSDIFQRLRRAEADEDYDTLRKMGYDCEHCDARVNDKTFNSRKCYIDNFAKYFALQFGPKFIDGEKS